MRVFRVRVSHPICFLTLAAICYHSSELLSISNLPAFIGFLIFEKQISQDIPSGKRTMLVI